jgi:hypothetical protein
VDYSISFFSQGADPGLDGITIHLASGPRFFPWVRTYMWSREAFGAPYLVTSGLMALEAWAHRRLDNGEPFETVLDDVIGEPGAPVAYLLPVVDLILSHWEQAVEGAVPFVASPELLALDRQRYVRDNPPKLPKPAIFEELEVLQKEPPGTVSNEELKKRNSRSFMLDQVIGNYTFLTERPELYEQLRTLLADAAARLRPPTKSQGLFHAECMVLHALNKLNPENFSRRTLPSKGGGTVEVPFYISPAEEASHLESLELEGTSQERSSRNLRYQIKAAIQDSKQSTDQFFEDALAFARHRFSSDRGHNLARCADRARRQPGAEAGTSGLDETSLRSRLQRRGEGDTSPSLGVSIQSAGSFLHRVRLAIQAREERREHPPASQRSKL